MKPMTPRYIHDRTNTILCTQSTCHMHLLTLPNIQYISICLGHHICCTAGPGHPQKPAYSAPQYYPIFWEQLDCRQHPAAGTLLTPPPLPLLAALFTVTFGSSCSDPPDFRLAGYYHTRAPVDSINVVCLWRNSSTKQWWDIRLSSHYSLAIFSTIAL